MCIINFFGTGNNEPAPRAIRVQGCDARAAICNVRRQQTTGVQVLFVANHPSQQVRVEASLRVVDRAIQFPFPIRQANLCEHVTNAARPTQRARCPLARGQNFIWTMGLEVPARAQTGARVEVTFRARDNRRNVIFCAVLRTRVIG